MRRGLAFLAGLLAAAGAGGARAETLITSLSTSRVAIASNYTGSQMVVFGAIERDGQTGVRSGSYEVVVSVRGPRETLTVRQREPVGPFWINRDQQKFVRMPAFLGFYSSKPIDDVTTEAQQRRLKLGIQATVHSPEVTIDRGGVDDAFRAALIRLRTRDGLFVENDRGVTFLTPSVFRASIELPAIAPPGEYEVEVFLFADDALLARGTNHFEMVKIGFEQSIASLAANASLAYGIATGLTALFFGWLANLIFRRD